MAHISLWINDINNVGLVYLHSMIVASFKSSRGYRKPDAKVVACRLTTESFISSLTLTDVNCKTMSHKSTGLDEVGQT